MDVDGAATTTTTTTTTPLVHDVVASRRLVKTLLDQGFLAPFRQAVRPVLWDYAGSLHVYPLPTAAVIVDTTAPPFALTYEGCHVMNPGSAVVEGRRGVGRWIEWAVGGVGVVRECAF
jgi:DNA polymerase epsilon subunit 2